MCGEIQIAMCVKSSTCQVITYTLYIIQYIHACVSCMCNISCIILYNCLIHTQPMHISHPSKFLNFPPSFFLFCPEHLCTNIWQNFSHFENAKWTHKKVGFTRNSCKQDLHKYLNLVAPSSTGKQITEKMTLQIITHLCTTSVHLYNCTVVQMYMLNIIFLVS